MSFEKTWYMVPAHIRRLPGMTLALLDFFETIFEFWHRGRNCILKNETLMERTGIKSNSTIQAAFQYFEKHKIMRRTFKDGKRYIVQINSIENPEDPAEPPIKSDQNKNKNDPQICSQGVSAERLEGCRYSERGGVGTATHNKQNINIKILNTRERVVSPTTSGVSAVSGGVSAATANVQKQYTPEPLISLDDLIDQDEEYLATVDFGELTDFERDAQIDKFYYFYETRKCTVTTWRNLFQRWVTQAKAYRFQKGSAAVHKKNGKPEANFANVESQSNSYVQIPDHREPEGIGYLAFKAFKESQRLCAGT